MSEISEGDLVVMPEIMEELERRISKARSEYPEPNPNFKALISEIGELAETLIDLDRYEDNTYSEALDVAVVALRIAHVEYHGVSEDECETCGGKGQVDAAESEPVDYEVMKDCPDCTEGDSYDEPRPEDEEWRREAKRLMNHDLASETIFQAMERLGYPTKIGIADPVMDYIDDLESELSDCREELAEVKEELETEKRLRSQWKQAAMRFDIKELEDCRERIEEARKLLVLGEIRKAFEKLKDSDEAS